MPHNVNHGELLAATGLRVIHLTSRYGRKITVAYRQPFPNSETAAIAVVIANPKDVYSKREGTSMAISAYQSGRYSLIPVGPDIIASLKEMFE